MKTSLSPKRVLGRWRKNNDGCCYCAKLLQSLFQFYNLTNGTFLPHLISFTDLLRTGLNTRLMSYVKHMCIYTVFDSKQMKRERENGCLFCCLNEPDGHLLLVFCSVLFFIMLFYHMNAALYYKCFLLFPVKSTMWCLQISQVNIVLLWLFKQHSN